MTTTNYKGYRIESSRCYGFWIIAVHGGITQGYFKNSNPEIALSQAKAWIDAQEGTE